jgi:hypothetical protein
MDYLHLVVLMTQVFCFLQALGLSFPLNAKEGIYHKNIAAAKPDLVVLQPSPHDLQLRMARNAYAKPGRLF